MSREALNGVTIQTAGVLPERGVGRFDFGSPSKDSVTFVIMGFAGPKTFAEILKSRHETPDLLGGIYAGVPARL